MTTTLATPELQWLHDSPLATLVLKDCINGFIGSIDIDTQGNVLFDWINNNKLEALVVVGKWRRQMGLTTVDECFI